MRVIILSPIALHRAAWAALLTGQPDIEPVAAVEDIRELSRFQTIPPPLTLLIDYQKIQPELIGNIREFLPKCGLLFLVNEENREDIVTLLKAGATGVLSRNQQAGDLFRAILAVGRGEMVLPAQLAFQSLLFLAGDEETSDDPLEPLTARENDVLILLAGGQTNKDIAQTLFLSVRTVEAHMSTIFGKIGVRSRTEAALWAVKRGYGRND